MQWQLYCACKMLVTAVQAHCIFNVHFKKAWITLKQRKNTWIGSVDARPEPPPRTPTPSPLPPCPPLPRAGGKNQLRSTICQLPLETFNSNKIYGPSFQRILPVKSISWSHCKRRPLFGARRFMVRAPLPGLWNWGELRGNGWGRKTCASIFTSGRSRDWDLVLLRSQGRATTQADDCQEFDQTAFPKWRSRVAAALHRWSEKIKMSCASNAFHFSHCQWAS